MSKTIEVWEGHDVTDAAISCNIGSGLLEAMKIDPHAYSGGSIIDIVCRVQIGEVSYKPVNKDDNDGPWKRIHKAKALAAVPTDNGQVGKILDTHIGKVSKRRELPGQVSIDDQIDPPKKAKAPKKGTPVSKRTGKPAPKKPKLAAVPDVPPAEAFYDSAAVGEPS